MLGERPRLAYPWWRRRYGESQGQIRSARPIQIEAAHPWGLRNAWRAPSGTRGDLKPRSIPRGGLRGIQRAGQCAVTALVVQDHCGGSILSGEVNGIPHYWNRLPTNEELDLTLRQFGRSAHHSKVATVRPRLHSLIQTLFAAINSCYCASVRVLPLGPLKRLFERVHSDHCRQESQSKKNV